MATAKKRSGAASSAKLPFDQKAGPAALTPAGDNGSAESADDTLRRLYALLLKCRLVQEHAKNCWPNSATASYDLALGEEAIVAGTTFGLLPGDAIAVSPRNLAAAVAQRAPLKRLLAADGGNSGFEGAAVIGCHAAHPFNLATGIALAHQLEKKDSVALALCVESCPSLEHYREALSVASVRKLPAIYVVKNHNPAANPSSGCDEVHFETVSFSVGEFALPAIVVDGRDLVAVWRVAQESIHRARIGSGPTLILCTMANTGDPLGHMEHYMKKRGAWSEAWKKRLMAQLKAEIGAAVREL